LLSFILCVLTVHTGQLLPVAAQNQQRSPSDTVREFYKAMRDKRFREAFAMSIYKPAVEGLSPKEFEDLRPDFERLALAISEKIPEKLETTGEQISADSATVFVKVKDAEAGEKTEPIELIRVDGSWIIGDKENQAVVRKAGKDFFFNARIDTPHNEVQDMLKRVALAQFAYSQQHNGQFGDMASLIAAGLIPKDLEGTDTTGYRFHINVTADKKGWSASAEPAQYGRTGKLSFFSDASGIRSSDVAGKPLIIPPARP
ncbi:MAG: hypothetical protein ACRD6N_13015, partial [Pyrinomonadaceae bacterium]